MNDAKTKAVKKVYHQLMSRSYVPYTVEEALQDVWDAAMKETEIKRKQSKVDNDFFEEMSDAELEFNIKIIERGLRTKKRLLRRVLRQQRLSGGKE